MVSNNSLESEKSSQRRIGEKVLKGYKKGVTAYKPSAKERRVSQIARKAVSLAAPKGSMVRAITTTTKKKGSKGRGRPSGSFKTRVLPSGKTVKVPTHIYKKMLSAEKSQMRLAQAQQTAQVAMQADQLAMQQDPRYQPSAEDQFLAEPDQQHEMDVMMAQQQADIQQAEQQYQQQAGQQQAPSVGQRVVKGLGDFGRGLSRIGAPRQRQMYDQFGRPVMEQPPSRLQLMGSSTGARGMEIRGEPRVTAISETASLLKVPNIFNNPGQSNLARRRSY